LAYVVFPALGWAGLRFGRRGATLAIAVAAGFAVWNTTDYHGPFVFDSVAQSVLTTQLYIGVEALSTLCLAALVSERKQFAERLTASRARVVRASDSERARLEHNLHDGAQQRLTALVIRLGVDAESAGGAHEPGPRALLRAQDEVLLAIDELRELAHGIHPQALTAGGLAVAIREIAARSTIPITVELPATRFDQTAEATAYYIVAEALTSAHKHAPAGSRLSATRRSCWHRNLRGLEPGVRCVRAAGALARRGRSARERDGSRAVIAASAAYPRCWRRPAITSSIRWPRPCTTGRWSLVAGRCWSASTGSCASG
jgi:glucose-6-phosphate-specific signal transduction histidine kinase